MLRSKIRTDEKRKIGYGVQHVEEVDDDICIGLKRLVFESLYGTCICRISPKMQIEFVSLAGFVEDEQPVKAFEGKRGARDSS